MHFQELHYQILFIWFVVDVLYVVCWLKFYFLLFNNMLLFVATFLVGYF